MWDCTNRDRSMAQSFTRSGGQVAPKHFLILNLFHNTHTICSAILSLVLYFVIGTAILYFVKGARGLEAFPNYAFWKELPVLIKVTSMYKN